jgi:hypothetical protein
LRDKCTRKAAADRDRLLIQHGTNLGGKLIERERLGDEIHAGIEHPTVHHRVRGIAGRAQHFQTRTPEQRFIGEFFAVGIRHHHVGEQQLDIRFAVENGERISRILAVKRRPLTSKI